MPLDAWADAMTETAWFGGSSEWFGWPKQCYCVEIDIEEYIVTQLAVTEFDIASMIYDALIAVILLIGNAVAIEVFTRRFSHLSRFSLATTFALMATLATYASLHSTWPTRWAVNEVVGLIQELAMLLIFVSIFVCWYALFHFAATRLIRRPN